MDNITATLADNLAALRQFSEQLDAAQWADYTAYLAYQDRKLGGTPGDQDRLEKGDTDGD